MQNIHQQIEQLTESQVDALLILIGKKYGQESFLNAEHKVFFQQLSETNNGVLQKLILHSLVAQKEEIKTYLQKQLSNNKAYLEKLKYDFQYRSSADVLPYLFLLIAALGINIKLETKDGKLTKFELNTGLLAITSINVLYQQLREQIDKGDIIIHTDTIHVGDKNTTNNYGNIDKQFNIQNNNGDFLFGVDTTNDKQILKEIQALKKQLNLDKHDIVEKIQISNVQLEKALMVAIKQMTEKDTKTVQKAIEDAQYLAGEQAQQIIYAITDSIDYLSTDLKVDTAQLKAMLTSTDPISTKLRIAIPFLPFISILKEYDAGNPLHEWWKKMGNIVL